MLNHELNKVLFVNAVIFSILLCSLVSCKSDHEEGIVARMKKLDGDGQLVVQLAELKIDSTQLDAYLEFLKEEIETSVRKEPGVLSLYAMADANDPSKITLVEIYANKEAYDAHIESSHFQKYKTGTITKVDSLRLTRMKPVLFEAKGN